MSKEVVVGIEFQNDIVRFTELMYTNEHVLVTKIKSVSVPPKTIINGDVTDPSGLSDQITRTLEEMETEAEHVVVCVTGIKFFKHLRQFPIIKVSELKELLEEEVASSALFFREDFQLGYQSFKDPSSSKDDTPYQHVLYGAVTTSQVESMQELVDMMGLNLNALDISALAALRLFMYRNTTTEPVISVFIDESYIDLNIYIEKDVYYTFTLQIDIDENTDFELLVEHIVNRIGYFLFSYSNHCFDKPMPTVGVVFSRNSFLDGLFSALQDHFPTIVWETINCTSLINVDASLNVSEQQLMDYAIPIGLGLKSFEDYNKRTLSLSEETSLTKPFFDQKELKIAGAVLAFALLVVLGINTFIVMSQDRIVSKVSEVQNKIRRLQSGEFIARQNRLSTFQAKLKKYNRIRDEKFSKTSFLRTLVDELPEDLSFKSIRLHPDRKVQIIGASFYQDSIYHFYNHLKDNYSKVTLSSIVTKYDKNLAPINHFQVSFKRGL
ncbi:hypothetical protein DID80_04290 [Candidatus Marinamargulisbacteria bacterium SCGC AAA071-K20]|nr:hypothetical protein DID80_04290 [Candidatus Marinamargulisbacteria bacterium SCGC AAA071-K20]